MLKTVSKSGALQSHASKKLIPDNLRHCLFQTVLNVLLHDSEVFAVLVLGSIVN